MVKNVLQRVIFQNQNSKMKMIYDLDFTDPTTLLTSFLLLFLVVYFRYLFLSGAYHWIFLVIFRKKLADRILSHQKPKAGQTKRELLLSTYSALIFSIMGLFLLLLWQQGYTKIYANTSEYPLWYIPISILIFLVLHDTYYYWLHKWMHTSKWMRRFHMEHHKSVDTTVFTSFSFHPAESFLQAVIVPLLFMIIPMSVLAVIITLFLMTFSAIVNHAGVEIYGIVSKSNSIGKYIIGATHHDSHHRNSKKNFGLYFTFWDWIMKTEQ